MKIKLDENLPEALVARLAVAGHDTDTVAREGLGGAADSEVWRAVQDDERLLITLDLDFSDIRRYPLGSHFGILLLRPRHQGGAAVIGLVVDLLRRENLDALAGCLAVADDSGACRAPST